MDFNDPLHKAQLKTIVEVVHLVKNSTPLTTEQHEKLDSIFLTQMDEGERKSILHAWAYLMTYTENQPNISLKPKDFFHVQNLLSLHHEDKPFLAKYEDFSEYTELVEVIKNFNEKAKKDSVCCSSEELWIFDQLVSGWQLMCELWHLLMGVVAYRTRVLMCRLIFALVCIPIFNVPIPLYVSDDQWYYGVPIHNTINSAYICANNLKEILLENNKVSSNEPKLTHLGQLFLFKNDDEQKST